jgi:hypothetical protein
MQTQTAVILGAANDPVPSGIISGGRKWAPQADFIMPSFR